MREIKFRGRKLNTSEWVYGYYFCDGVDHFIIVPEKDSLSSNRYDLYEVDLETVGQYIGLPDKHGKEIYEGDRVKGRYLGLERTLTVEHFIGFEGDGRPFSGFCLEIDGVLDYETEGVKSLDCEVIGNRWDTPN